ncbi:hypothetical protein WJ04_02255 [Burkholderia vietnamiensis]|nr:hypothetical protein WJ04_02255 [Burkholderia vietnamiensis]
MSISLKVLKILVPCDGRNFHYIQPLFKQAASGFMSQIMEMECPKPAFVADAAESVLHGGLC